MQLFHGLILLFASLAAAQFPDIPPCAINCLVGPLTKDGCPSLTDFACHCQKPDLVSQVTPCVSQSCGLPEQSSVSKLVVAQCSSAGYPISVPNPGAPTSAPATTTTGAGTTQASATGSMTIPTGSSVTTTTPKPSSSGASSSHAHGSSSTPGASSSHASGGGAGGASSSGGSPSASKSGSGTDSASPPLKTNGATQITGSLAGMAIAAAAVFYRL
ncbi:hypothetical protein ETB97_006098 [Aspergillus alliaceus]|uniref:Uncharacterized protein n=1 Tax=Petromyces alliaceus TaxID=209559 RepID=A0A5N6G7G7_PETAA|nr:uncharacterized protein BDW43DRAFT_306776 [Aspergillus alliaceus]KAB8238078.1 hypothetical protein BDW43DRAFT_306776 [Aspergillus alliaceus]KAF5864872.1 hypothetical protein ETB97_006098 [Aspergillus burnettii]